jgi:hypothetical protein
VDYASLIHPTSWHRNSGVVFSEVADRILYAFAPTEGIASDIEERLALHVSIVAGQITGLPGEFVQVLPTELGGNRVWETFEGLSAALSTCRLCAGVGPTMGLLKNFWILEKSGGGRRLLSRADLSEDCEPMIKNPPGGYSFG